MNDFNNLLENSPEQLRVLQAARSGDSIVVEALANGMEISGEENPPDR